LPAKAHGGGRVCTLLGILLVRTAGFPTCGIADFPIGRPFRSRARPVSGQSAGWETRDTADWEVCGTPAVVRRRKADRPWFEIARCLKAIAVITF
jgi:hypothetical protein